MAKYPDINVNLIGQDGNAFNLLGITQREMKNNGVPDEEINQFFEEATSGNYDNLLATIMEWVNVS